MVSQLWWFLGLTGLFALLLPIGDLLVRGAVILQGQRSRLTWTEQGLLAFYAAGGLLYAIAIIPMPLYSAGTVWGLIVGGAIGDVGLRLFQRSRKGVNESRPTFPWPLAPIALGTIGLLLFELLAAPLPPLPNPYDGSVQALYAQLLLAHGTVATTLQPYAAAGIVYPQAAATWLTLPTLLWGWPLNESPLLLPPLFLSLTIPAAYSLGERFGGVGSREGRWQGLLFAGFFGLVASWPRFFVGGSYDFAFALPLYLVILGWVPHFGQHGLRSWRDSGTLGVLLGSLTALSVAVGETVFLVLLGAILTATFRGRVAPRRWIPQFLATVGIAALFVVRYIYLFLMWFNYPGHVVQATGSPPYAANPAFSAVPSMQDVMGWLDPFVPWKWKLSPIPVLSLEIATLLAAGLLLLAFSSASTRPRLGRCGLTSSSFVVGGITAVTALFTGFLVLAKEPAAGLGVLNSFTSVGEVSFLLFISFELVALIPLSIAARFLYSQTAPQDVGAGSPGRGVMSISRGRRMILDSGRSHRLSQPVSIALAVVVLLLPLGSGLVATIGSGPGVVAVAYGSLANSTAADVQGLEWAGAHLPACSGLLVAPGSAAQFLPGYGQFRVVFPMLPFPVNLSYQLALNDLSNGVYDSQVRSALLFLNITEVFVTGDTFPGYPAFQSQAMTGSADFHALFVLGDVAVFEFLPGTTEMGCPP